MTRAPSDMNVATSPDSSEVGCLKLLAEAEYVPLSRMLSTDPRRRLWICYGAWVGESRGQRVPPEEGEQ